MSDGSTPDGHDDRRPAALVINPGARRSGRVERTLAEALRRRGRSLDRVVRVGRPGRLARAVLPLIDRGFGRIIVGGGDGTLGTVAPLLAGRDCRLGVLPLGTANDFARTLGIPDTIDDAAEIAAGDSVRAVDLGRANDAFFLNVASVGMSVAALDALSPGLKKRLGPAAYAFAGAKVFLRHDTFRARLRTGDGKEAECSAHQVVVANGRFYGGGVLVARQSEVDDGLLHAYALGTRGRWQLLRTMALLKFRVPLERPGDEFLQSDSIVVETWPDLPVNLDGEVRTRTPVEFSIERGALRVLAPEEVEGGFQIPGFQIPENNVSVKDG